MTLSTQFIFVLHNFGVSKPLYTIKSMKLSYSLTLFLIIYKTGFIRVVKKHEKYEHISQKKKIQGVNTIWRFVFIEK